MRTTGIKMMLNPFHFSVMRRGRTVLSLRRKIRLVSMRGFLQSILRRYQIGQLAPTFSLHYLCRTGPDQLSALSGYAHISKKISMAFSFRTHFHQWLARRKATSAILRSILPGRKVILPTNQSILESQKYPLANQLGHISMAINDNPAQALATALPSHESVLFPSLSTRHLWHKGPSGQNGDHGNKNFHAIDQANRRDVERLRTSEPEAHQEIRQDFHRRQQQLTDHVRVETLKHSEFTKKSRTEVVFPRLRPFFQKTPISRFRFGLWKRTQKLTASNLPVKGKNIYPLDLFLNPLGSIDHGGTDFLRILDSSTHAVRRKLVSQRQDTNYSQSVSLVWRKDSFHRATHQQPNEFLQEDSMGDSSVRPKSAKVEAKRPELTTAMVEECTDRIYDKIVHRIQRERVLLGRRI